MESTAEVSGYVSIRPVRVGWLLKSDHVSFRAAVEYNSSIWGGVYNLIFTEGWSSEAISERAELAFLDYVAPFDSPEEDHPNFGEISGLRYRGPGRQSMDHGLLDANRFYQQVPGTIAYPSIPEDDPLASLVYAMFGKPGVASPSVVPSSMLDATAPQGICGLAANVTLLRATAIETRYAVAETRKSIAVIDSANIDHLVGYWNLRAVGVDVFPWDEKYAARMTLALQSWLDGLVNPSVLTEPNSHLVGAVPSELAVWDFVGGLDLATTLASECSRRKLRLVAEGRDRPTMPVGLSPIKTRFRSYFEASPVRSRGRSRGLLSLRMPPVSEPFTLSSHNGIVAADLEFAGESDLPRGESTRVPPIRTLGRLLSTFENATESFTRPTPRGCSIGLAAGADAIFIKPVPAIAIFESLLGNMGWKFGQSDNGLFGEQLAERLGGRGTTMPNSRPVRAVLHAAANADRASPFSVFLQKARDQLRRHKNDYYFPPPQAFAENVVYELLRAKLLHPAMEVRCPHCANSSDVSPGDLSVEMACTFCDRIFPLGFAVAIRRGSAASWKYRLSPSVQPARLMESLALLATFSTVGGLNTGSSYTIMGMLGLTVNAPGVKCEIDVAILVDRGPGLMPRLMIGEVKSRQGSITGQDVVNLELVRDAISAAGLPCSILFASLRAKLEDAEVAELRSYCERSVSDGGREFEFPLVLTEDDLSAEWMSSRHPARWLSVGQGLDELAIESCRRNLGLSMNFAYDSEIAWRS